MAKAPSRPNHRTKRNNKKRNNDYLVVGVGASAGGIKPLEDMLEMVSQDAHLTFIVVVHLSPEYESNLGTLLQRKSRLPVSVVTEATRLEPNHVFVIPPGKHLLIEDGSIALVEPDQPRGMRVPIDRLFRSLADAYETRAVGVVLSGTGTDGTLGLRRIKEQGGIAIAQDPLEAEYDGMPRSAINSGFVDFILPLNEIPRKLADLREISASIQLWPEGDRLPEGREAEALRGVLSFVRARTGHDFTSYKRSTVLRRLARRLQVNQISFLSNYLLFLREHPSEANDLLKDLLINVTNFFRDQEVFKTLAAQIIPRMFEDRGDSDQIRVWVAGCATGEEAYSMAMLLREFADDNSRAQNIQIFASDIEIDAIGRAREGVFPDSIEADVPQDKLRRFFTKEEHHYRIKKEIREMVLFAPHNVLRDPPFSRLDLISCRNLLIYLNRDTQERLLELFHFALRPEGYLLLGSSESAEAAVELFTPVDKKFRIYQRRSIRLTEYRVPEILPHVSRWDRKYLEGPGYERKPLPYGEIHQALLEQYAPPSIVANPDYDIVHLSENAGKYLRFTGGEPSRNLLRAVHPDLRLELRAALFQAQQEAGPAEIRGLRVKLDGDAITVSVVVRPILKPDEFKGFWLVLIEDITAKEIPEVTPSAAQGVGPRDFENVVKQLEDELQRTKTQLRASIEQYETSTEELKASNEELQAINEELRSTTEELETSKEELQSLNEELTTVNYELKEKIDEVSRFNSDLQNLMASTDIGTIFLSRELVIKRYTPRAQDLFNIIPSDIDRPFAHITHRLEYAALVSDAQTVLDRLTRVDREVRSATGRWYIARLLPYRTIEDRIDGVVLTFVDITERKAIAEEMEKRASRVTEQARLLDVTNAILRDTEDKITFWSETSARLYGYSKDEAIGKVVYKLLRTEFPAPRGEIMTRLFQNDMWTGELVHFTKEGSRLDVAELWVLHRDDAGRPAAIMQVGNDISERKRTEAELMRARDQLEQRVKERTEQLQKSYEDLKRDTAARHRVEDQVQELLRRIVGAQERERRRIARDLHDHLGQQLTALRLTLESVSEQVKAEALVKEQVDKLKAIASRLDADVDFLAWELHSAALEEQGLAGGIEIFLREWSKHFGVAAHFHTAGLDTLRLTNDVESNLYRMAQEALNNVSKHAQANSVDVILERRGNEVVLIIEDNGKGFNIGEGVAAGLGLKGMRERSAAIGGELEVESSRGQGTTVFVKLPISADGRGKNE